MLPDQRRSFTSAVSASFMTAAALVGFAGAEEAPPADLPVAEPIAVEPPAAEPLDERPQRVIVLSTGRVVLGDVVERPGGYLVRERFGSTVVPFTQVLLTAADLPDAYRKLSRSIGTPTAGKHMALARWCFDQRLYDAAQTEIKRALLLEPDRREAREFLQTLQRTLDSGVHGGAVGGRSDPAFPVDPSFPGQAWKAHSRQQQLVRPESGTSLGGLAPETVEVFVLQVQPLLMNKCGNARCHGQAATNDFRLTPVRRGMSGYRVFTEKNLSSVLRQVDLDTPPSSALLSVLEGLHGDAQRPLFLGPSAEQQQTTLRQWVLQAAAEKRTRIDADDARSVAAEDADAAPVSLPRRDPFLQQILAEERPDAFDPDVFNRLAHGRAGATDRSPSQGGVDR